MIQLPDGFDPSVLTSDLYSLALPFITVAVLVSSVLLIIKICKRVS